MMENVSVALEVSLSVYDKKKTLKNIRLRNRWTGFKETWHEALMAKVLQCVYKS